MWCMHNEFILWMWILLQKVIYFYFLYIKKDLIFLDKITFLTFHKNIFDTFCGGYKTGKPVSMPALGLGPRPRKAHPLAMGRTLLGHKWSRGQREQLGPGDDTTGISPNKKSTKTTKNKGKAAITTIKYFALDRAMLFNFYNHPQPLWVWADGTSISPTNLNLHVDVREKGKS